MKIFEQTFFLQVGHVDVKKELTMLKLTLLKLYKKHLKFCIVRIIFNPLMHNVPKWSDTL